MDRCKVYQKTQKLLYLFNRQTELLKLGSVEDRWMHGWMEEQMSVCEQQCHLLRCQKLGEKWIWARCGGPSEAPFWVDLDRTVC